MGDRLETRAGRYGFLIIWVDNRRTFELWNNNEQLVWQSMRHDLYSCINFDRLTHMSQAKLSYRSKLSHA